MSAVEFLSVLSQAVYVVIFVIVLRRTLRHPTPAHVDMAIFFGIIAGTIAVQRLGPLVFGAPLPAWIGTVVLAGIMALPYVLLRLVRDFSHVHDAVVRVVEAGFVASLIAAVAFGGAVPPLVLLAMVAYFAAVAIYCSAAFIRASRGAQGVTKRRFESLSAGSVFIGLALLVAGSEAITPELDVFLNATVQLLGLASGLAFYLGSAPPLVLKRAWQAPELHAFLARAAELPRLPTTTAIVRELERSAAAATGAKATLGLWDEDRGVLAFLRAAPSEEKFEVRSGELAGGRAFAAQRVEFSADPARDHPEGAGVYRATGVGAAIAAPITSGERRLGVLCIYAERPPFFAVSDMELAGLLAAQAATILEARALIDHAARVRAREEATRLKEDFLSAAAHDLRTPLTTVVAQAQFLERRSLRDPGAPTDIKGLQRIAREAERLAALVTDLLDVARLEQRRLVGEREPVDLGSLISEVAARHDAPGRPVKVEVRTAVVGSYDRRRIEQLLENLIENATKYSTGSAAVNVEVWQDTDTARIAVRDHGIGIPAADMPHIFDRFSRGSNVDDRRFHGMGLGLYICRGIVEEHGGRIWAESDLGKGATFHVALPLGAEGRLN